MSTAAPRIGSLCSGYGGLDMAVEAVFGGRTMWHCEIEDAPSKILAAHWDVPNHRDLKSVDWSTVEPVDIMTAGYPCQPFSHAGRRGGTDDPRHLWPFVAEAVRRVRPRFVVLENVAGHRTLGFDAVLGELAEAGYDAQWVCLRAADVGAPHGRERLFILATDATVESGGVGDGDDVRIWGYQERSRQTARSSAVTDSGGGGWERRRADGQRGPHDAATGCSDPTTPYRDEPGSQGSESARRRHMPDGGAPPDSQRRGRDRGTREQERCALNGTPTARCGEVSRGDVFAGRWCACEPAADSSSDGRHEGWPESARLERGSDAPLSGDPATPDASGSRLAQHPAEPSTQETRADGGYVATGDRGPRAATDWGPYRPAIERWERATGRVAPAPTELAPRGGQRLSPRFVEWMMGLPAGWVTDVPISRNEQLKALGNGVVPQQAVEALRRLLPIATEAAA